MKKGNHGNPVFSAAFGLSPGCCKSQYLSNA